MSKRAAVLLPVLLAGCAAVAPPPAPAPAPTPADAEPAASAVAAPPPDPAQHTCDGGRIVFLRFGEDSLVVEGADIGSAVLLRDAGGVGPRQSVWSNEKLRVETGLGDDGEQVHIQLLGVSGATWICRRG